jgi:copper oxidase (laccase) domain-containing protein
MMEPVVLKTVGGAVGVGYSGKLLGNNRPRFSHDGNDNFAKFMAKFPGKTVYDMPAVGKDSIANVDKLTPEQIWDTEADALITHSPSALLVLKAADCIPLVFYVPGQNVLALAHVGTSGAALHLPSKVIEQMGCPAEQIRCYVGPSISQKSYRFPPDYDFDHKKLDASWQPYITKEPDGIHINLFGYVFDELKSSGIVENNIEVEEVDTGSDAAYFSHRRHKLTGEPDGRNCFGVCLV